MGPVIPRIAAGLVALGVVAGTALDRAPPRPASYRAGYRVLEADFHAHTRFSDGFLSPFDLVLQADRRGLDVLAITEHNITFPGMMGRWFARRVGGPEVMRAQIEHLMRERDRANIIVQILPFSSGEHPAMLGPFYMLTFIDPADTGVVNVENVTGAHVLEKPEEMRAYEEVWHAIQAKAVSPADSRAIMRTYALR